MSTTTFQFLSGKFSFPIPKTKEKLCFDFFEKNNFQSSLRSETKLLFFPKNSNSSQNGAKRRVRKTKRKKKKPSPLLAAAMQKGGKSKLLSSFLS